MLFIMSKETRINVRTTDEIKQSLEITAKLRGLTVSALVNSLVVKAIREEKEREPRAFQNSRGILATTIKVEPAPNKKKKAS